MLKEKSFENPTPDRVENGPQTQPRSLGKPKSVAETKSLDDEPTMSSPPAGLFSTADWSAMAAERRGERPEAIDLSADDGAEKGAEEGAEEGAGGAASPHHSFSRGKKI